MNKIQPFGVMSAFNTCQPQTNCQFAFVVAHLSISYSLPRCVMLRDEKNVVGFLVFCETNNQNEATIWMLSSVVEEPAGPTPPLLTWKVAQKKMPWNIVLLLGGGFALAKGSEVYYIQPHITHTWHPFTFTHVLHVYRSRCSRALRVLIIFCMSFLNYFTVL